MDFPDEEVSTLLGMLEPLGLDVARVSWRNGHPSITDRGMNIDRSRPPATREQIDHFLQIMNCVVKGQFARALDR